MEKFFYSFSKFDLLFWSFYIPIHCLTLINPKPNITEVVIDGEHLTNWKYWQYCRYYLVILNVVTYSQFFGFGRHFMPPTHPFEADSMMSNFGMYGLMSISDVSSRISTPLTVSILPTLSISWIIDIPIEFGRHGCLDAYIPWGSSSKKVGRTSWTSPARSNKYKMWRCEKVSMF